MKFAAICGMCCALAGTVASAADFEARRTGSTSLADVVIVDNTAAGGSFSDTVDAGQFNFVYTDTDGERGAGQFADGSFSTFCGELQGVRNGVRAYDLIPVTDGPNPQTSNFGETYDAADEAELNAVVAAAIRLGWINDDLSATADTTTVLRAAVQIGIWRTLFDNSEFTVLDTEVEARLNELEAEAATAPDARVAGLKLMSNLDSQDMLFVDDVDLPPVLECKVEEYIDTTVEPCDWNMDGMVDWRDFVAFVDDYKQCDADFNGDGRTNYLDFCEFVHCYRKAKRDQWKNKDAQLWQVSWTAEDDNGDVFVDAYIQTECEMIPVTNGEVIEVRCPKKRRRHSDDCGSMIVDGRLVVTATEIELVVIARDAAGNEVDCSKQIEIDCRNDCYGGGHGKHRRGRGGRNRCR